MHRLILASVAAISLSIGATSAFAMPIGVATNVDINPDVTLVSGGCGFYYHRGPFGGCRPNGYAPGYRVCPPGYHLGPYGRLCRPNF